MKCFENVDDTLGQVNLYRGLLIRAPAISCLDLAM
jgi:hypothetical protein